MTVQLLPDAVATLREYLLTCDDVVTLIDPNSTGAQTRIATQSPEITSRPWIRITRVGGPRSASAPMRTDRALLQVDCFAPPEGAGSSVAGDYGAMKLARTVRAYLEPHALRNYADSEGVVTNIEELLGPQNRPDTSRKPPTPRVQFTVAVTVRPID